MAIVQRKERAILRDFQQGISRNADLSGEVVAVPGYPIIETQEYMSYQATSSKGLRFVDKFNGSQEWEDCLDFLFLVFLSIALSEVINPLTQLVSRLDRNIHRPKLTWQCQIFSTVVHLLRNLRQLLTKLLSKIPLEHLYNLFHLQILPPVYIIGNHCLSNFDFQFIFIRIELQYFDDHFWFTWL